VSTTAEQTHEGTEPAPAGSKNSKAAWRFIRDILIILLIAIVISFLIKTFLVRSFYIPSASMENTLQINDRILVNELVPTPIGLERGDVVVFSDPGGWLGPSAEPERSGIEEGVDAVLGFIGLTAPDSNDHLIKRVIGLPGDTVTCCSAHGQLVINGVPIDEPYIVLNGQTKATRDDFTVTVPEGFLWVMGDNRYNSGDSVAHRNDPSGGFVPIDNVVGRALVISWPANRWSWLDNYSSVFEGVEPK
jgi:signal peptidase I